MAQASKKQPQYPNVELPSFYTRVGVQVSSLISRGLNLAYEIEAALPSSIGYPQVDPSGSTDPLAPLPSPLDRLGTSPTPHPLESPTQIQRVVAQPPPLAVEPQNAEQTSWAMVWLHRGLHKYQHKDYGGAKDNFKQALQKQPTLGAAYNGLGGVLYQLGEFLEAIVVYHQALDHTPEKAQIYCNLGSALYQLQDFDEAVLAYEQALHWNSSLQLAYYGLGLAYYQNGSPQVAATAFEQATQLDQTHAESFLGLGVALYALGDLQEAAVASHQAMQLNPRYRQTYLALHRYLYDS
ncbi:MAG: tetratricopeptide repeat protein [Acaryochloris sp. RU_4_1]|nr:tetratricopeptide repeat protein [Acaryochloris sp. RU_4_1]NJR53793.1 tetratricopeptide repeat protein [Acaryochloris sp. CRU_2_0]